MDALNVSSGAGYPWNQLMQTVINLWGRRATPERPQDVHDHHHEEASYQLPHPSSGSRHDVLAACLFGERHKVVSSACCPLTVLGERLRKL